MNQWEAAAMRSDAEQGRYTRCYTRWWPRLGGEELSHTHTNACTLAVQRNKRNKVKS